MGYGEAATATTGRFAVLMLSIGFVDGPGSTTAAMIASLSPHDALIPPSDGLNLPTYLSTPLALAEELGSRREIGIHLVSKNCWPTSQYMPIELCIGFQSIKLYSDVQFKG
jgi:hypothetical protein